MLIRLPCAFLSIAVSQCQLNRVQKLIKKDNFTWVLIGVISATFYSVHSISGGPKPIIICHVNKWFIFFNFNLEQPAILCLTDAIIQFRWHQKWTWLVICYHDSMIPSFLLTLNLVLIRSWNDHLWFEVWNLLRFHVTKPRMIILPNSASPPRSL